jgi:hypothetical protein
MPSRRVAVPAVLAFAVTLASPVRADIPPPNTSQCREAKEGDACETDDAKKGACATRKCSRYVALRGGTVPPESLHDCLVCVEGAPRKAAKGCSWSGADAGAAGSSWLALGLVLLCLRRGRR